MKRKKSGLFQNKCKLSQLEKLIALVIGKMVHEGKNYTIKLRKYHFLLHPNRKKDFFLEIQTANGVRVRYFQNRISARNGKRLMNMSTDKNTYLRTTVFYQFL